jgi:hypothetical protein
MEKSLICFQIIEMKKVLSVHEDEMQQHHVLKYNYMCTYDIIHWETMRKQLA